MGYRVYGHFGNASLTSCLSFVDLLACAVRVIPSALYAFFRVRENPSSVNTQGSRLILSLIRQGISRLPCTGGHMNHSGRSGSVTSCSNIPDPGNCCSSSTALSLRISVSEDDAHVNTDIYMTARMLSLSQWLHFEMHAAGRTLEGD